MSEAGCSSLPQPYALRVIGNSMAPEFNDGHIIIVDPNHPLMNRAFVVIKQQEEVYFGQYEENDNEKWLRYLSEEHEDIQLNQFELLGVVTQRAGRRRKESKRYQYQSLN